MRGTTGKLLFVAGSFITSIAAFFMLSTSASSTVEVAARLNSEVDPYEPPPRSSVVVAVSIVASLNP